MGVSNQDEVVRCCQHTEENLGSMNTYKQISRITSYHSIFTQDATLMKCRRSKLRLGFWSSRTNEEIPQLVHTVRADRSRKL
jgi:hypothetical protein